MRTKTMIILTALTILTSITVESCSTSAEKVQDAQQDVTDANEALTIANEEYLADIEAYRIETAKKITSNDSTILAFKAQIKLEKKAANAEYEKQLAELEQQNIDMKKKMDEYNGEGADKWEIFKEEFSRDMQELGDAFRDLTIKNEK